MPILITNHVVNFKDMEPINIISIYCFVIWLCFIANERTCLGLQDWIMDIGAKCC